MKIGICKECFEKVPLITNNEVEGKEYSDSAIYECPECSYPNGIKCGDFWEIYEEDIIHCSKNDCCGGK